MFLLPLLLGEPVVHREQLRVMGLGCQFVHDCVLWPRGSSSALQGVECGRAIREGDKDRPLRRYEGEHQKLRVWSSV